MGVPRRALLVGITAVSTGCLESLPETETGPSSSERGVPSESTSGSSSRSTVTIGDANGGIDRHAIELWVHRYVNRERSRRDLPVLGYDERLQEIARYHSRDMAEKGYFSHVDPEGNDFQDRYRKFGYDCRVKSSGDRYATGAENIAYNFHHRRVDVPWSDETARYTTSEELGKAIVEQWMHSKGHRENVLREFWNREGIGAYIDGQKVYVTQNFC